MIFKIIIVLLSGVLIGYNIGYKTGIIKGKETVQRSLPLIYKEMSLEKGYCMLCQGKEPYKEMLKK